MNERFVFDGRCYKTVALKSGENHCEKCAFNELRECEYSPVLPYCDADKRNDGQNVYFVEAKTNFDIITASPEALSEFIMRTLGNECECNRCPVDDCDGSDDCVLLFKEWLGKEVEK